jgi:outer membrane lipoprotein LolB
VSGRLALQIDALPDRPAQSLSADFELRGDAERGELRLSSPLGTTLAEASWAPGEARLVTPQAAARFDDLDALSQEVFGEQLPLRALPDWLRGRPWRGAPAAARAWPTGPGFEQLGWTVDLGRLDSGLFQAQRAAAPVLRLRAQLESAP